MKDQYIPVAKPSGDMNLISSKNHHCILPTKKHFSAGHTVVLCGTPHKICRICFAEKKNPRAKSPAHFVSTCTCAPCKGTISFPDSSFLNVAFDCLPTCVIFTASGTLLKCGTELLCCGTAGQRSVLLDSPAECGTVGKYALVLEPL